MPVEYIKFEHKLHVDGREAAVKVRVRLAYEVEGGAVTTHRIKYLIVPSIEDQAYVLLFGNEIMSAVENRIRETTDEFFRSKGFA